ncbi:MAG TPA: NAD-binding protein [Thermoplasmata archaeon]|nr:NAD-binding protein [Thermoplasmata archaeon]
MAPAPSPAAEMKFPSFSARAPYVGLAAALVGLLMVLFGLLSAARPPNEFYHTPLAGYDPPFDVVAGLLLFVLSFRIRKRSPVAWLFSIPVPILAGAIAVLSPNVLSIASTVASAALLAAIYPYRASFYIGSATGPEGTQLLLVVASLVSLLFGTVGAEWLGGRFEPHITSWGEAVYFTVATISTIGATYQPTTDTARWFEVTLILIGVGTFLSAIVVLFVPFLERRLSRIGERLERAQMQELERHVIVCGATPEAHATAIALREAGVRFVILTHDPAAVERLKEEGFRVHHGDPSVEEELSLVGVARARSLIVAQESDAANLLTVITARALQPDLRIVAVATAESSLAKLRRAGATESIGVVRVAAQLICAAALDDTPERKPHAPSVSR